jgi:oxygen-independent coproporphyrinogen-3 oxidase
MMKLPPLSLYIHFPWCVKKCPYCDFNSHALQNELPEQAYIEALLLNLQQYVPYLEREIISIFMGGGTPSLFSAAAIDQLLKGIRERCRLSDDIEITLEANPGTVEQQRFKAYREIGINRISLGVQSFNDQQLTRLGRIHGRDEALTAIAAIKQAGFDNFNIDIMFGLPEQTIEEGLADIRTAMEQAPTHLSWYELTLEPNTYFWHHPPPLPIDDDVIALQEKGQALLQANGYQQYEVSAYSRQRPCQHNVNYWAFGDYLAIGAGSHAKITQMNQQIQRLHHFRHPKQYMNIADNFVQGSEFIPSDQLAFEFMLNALRLKEGVPTAFFSERTGLSLTSISPQLDSARAKGWIGAFEEKICTTALGYRFLNDVVSLFLTSETADEH